MHKAAWDGKVDITTFLIENRADVGAKDKNGETALHWAACDGRVDVALVLILLYLPCSQSFLQSLFALSSAIFTSSFISISKISKALRCLIESSINSAI